MNRVTRVFDTGDHRIGGVQQQQGGTVQFTSDLGTFDVSGTLVLTMTLPAPHLDDPDELFAAFAAWAEEQATVLYPAQEEALVELVGGANVVLATHRGLLAPGSFPQIYRGPSVLGLVAGAARTT